MKRLLAAAAVPLLAAAGLLAPQAAGASVSAPVAYVRAAHLSPDTPQVDVYLTAFRGGSTKLWISGVGYGDVSPYRRIEPGQYAVSMRPKGAPKSSKAALSWTLNLQGGRSYTAAAIGKQARLHGIVVKDSLDSPRSGVGYVRVVQASSTAPSVSVRAGSRTVTSSASFGSVTRYVAVPAGTVTLRATSLTNDRLTGTVRLKVASRSVNSVVLLDKQGGGIQARPLVDAAAAGRAPVGAVPAGGGGTASAASSDTSSADVGFAAGAIAVLLVSVGLVLLAGRRRTGAPV